MNESEQPSFGDVENEPTPYGIKDAAPASARSHNSKKASTKNKRLVIYIASGVVLFIGVAGWITYSQLTQKPAVPSTSPLPTATSTSQPSPNISLNVQVTGSSTVFNLQWNVLPTDTVKINVFYSSTQNGKYILIGALDIASSSLGGGSGSFTASGNYGDGYYYETPSDGGGSGENPTTPNAPAVPPSSPSDPGQGGGNGGSGGGNPPPGNGSTTQSGGGNGGGDNGGGGGNPSSTAQNFLVQHFDEKIQISWQSLPNDAAQVVITRASSTDGPWNNVLIENNIASDGPFSIEVVDDTLGDPFYYEMNVYDKTGSPIISYGPILLGSL